MTIGNWIALLMRQTPALGPAGWDEVVVGHDFGFLTADEIRAWTLDLHVEGPAAAAVEALREPNPASFDAVLWAAAAACTGKAPRPGGQRWGRAQDRWRVALLKDALEAPLSPEALAVAVESIYECVGCPEDMLGLWEFGNPRERKAPVANHAAIIRFLNRQEASSALVTSLVA